MADAKITALDENTTPVVTDLLALVDDPDGTPKTEKITLLSLLAGGWCAYPTVIPIHDDGTQADDPSYEITFASVDLTGVLYAGMKVKLTQGTVKYFIITKVTLDGSDTDVVMYGGTDYDLVDTDTTAISLFNYSTARTPTGFPLDPTKWTVEVTDTSAATQATPTQNTWYNLASVSINIPIGLWRVAYQVCPESDDTDAVSSNTFVTLSDANNSESDIDFTIFVATYGADSGGGIPIRLYSSSSREKIISLATKDTYYLNAKTSLAGMSAVWIRGDLSKTIIRAICAYL